MNFLLQISGNKRVELWDPHDDTVMTPRQRDPLFSYDPNARPTWRADLQAKARRFDLAPGVGVHHPFIAPHLVTTSANLSISLAITYRTPHSDVLSDAHRYNDRMHPYGLGRIPVGNHAAVDHLKAGLMRAMRGTKATLRGRELADEGDSQAM